MISKSQPIMVSWNVTRECNLSCRHCYRDAGEKESNELSYDEGIRLIDEIAALGFKLLILSGGEPLLREDIMKLIEHAVAKGLRTVIGTNGTLITPAMAETLKKSGLSRAGISIDSRDSASHDAFRCREGAYRDALKGIEACREAGLPFQLHTTVREHNASEVEAITDLAIDCGAAAHHIFFLVPTGRASFMKKEQLRAQSHEKLLENILKRQKDISIELKPTCAPTFMRIARQMGLDLRFTRGCLAAVSYCVVTPAGEVHPCPYLPLSAGNVKSKGFMSLWNDALLLNELRKNKLEGKCGTCTYQDICGGCRARAFYASGGNMMASDPWCLFRGEEKKKAKE
jgi:AdoMet-dependent heme synthase